MKNVIHRMRMIRAAQDAGINAMYCSQYSETVLLSAFEKVNSVSLSKDMYTDCKATQKCMLDNTGFVDYLAYFSKNGVHGQSLDEFLAKVFDSHSPMEFSKESVLFALKNEVQLGKFVYGYLKYYADKQLTDTQKDIVVSAIHNMTSYKCNIQSLDELTNEERQVLTYPFAVHLSGEHIKKQLQLFLEKGDMFKIAILLHSNNDLYLEYEDYKSIAQQNTEQIYKNLETLLELVNEGKKEKFLYLWRENECPERDLRLLVQKLPGMTEEQISVVFISRATYINFLYGNKLRNCDVGYLPRPKEDVVVYALTFGKDRFLRLIEENYDTFSEMSNRSILFAPWFRKVVNVNSLNQKNFMACKDLIVNRPPAFREDTIYTFEEIRTLCSLPDCYTEFYSKLRQPRVDDRLICIRQLGKHHLVEFVHEKDFDRLAEMLAQKDLYRWLHEDFAHISNLSLRSAIDLLIHYETANRFLSKAQNETEVRCILRNRERLADYDSLDSLKKEIVQVDASWAALCEKMDFDESFVETYHEGIVSFILDNGTEIALAYLDDLDEEQCEAFRRIVVAELMGKFYKLKYHEGDLEKEIGMTVREKQKKEWSTLMTVKDGDIEVRECDGFFETMTLGEIPQHTCLSYVGGAYKGCLLSNFDSNKHFLYAYLNGEPVARAILRLTKGCFQQTRGEKSVFTFVNLDSDAGEKMQPELPDSEEKLTLFLEHSYSAKINSETLKKIEALFVKLAEEKAAKLQSRLVLNEKYTVDAYMPVYYWLYISRSKGGEQYIDSLGGHASVSDEQSYKENRFLMSKAELQSEKR